MKFEKNMSVMAQSFIEAFFYKALVKNRNFW